MPLSTSQIQSHFSHLSDPEPSKRSTFFSQHVSPDVNWTVMGHSPMSGTYTSLKSFLDATIQVLGDDILSEPLRLEVKNVIAMPMEGGTHAAVELAAMNSKGRNGMIYDQRYCWVVKYGDNEMINEARAYVDTELLTRVIEQNRK